MTEFLSSDLFVRTAALRYLRLQLDGLNKHDAAAELAMANDFEGFALTTPFVDEAVKQFTRSCGLRFQLNTDELTLAMALGDVWLEEDDHTNGGYIEDDDTDDDPFTMSADELLDGYSQ